MVSTEWLAQLRDMRHQEGESLEELAHRVRVYARRAYGDNHGAKASRLDTGCIAQFYKCSHTILPVCNDSGVGMPASKTTEPPYITELMKIY